MLGLDVGTCFCVAARKVGGALQYKKERTAFYQIEQGDFTKKLLDNSKVNYIEKQGDIYVIGDEALKFSNLFNKEVRRPLAQGMLSPKEKEAIPMLRVLIEELVGKPSEPNELVMFSCPANPVDANKDNLYHEKVISEILKDLGYSVKPMNEALAIVYSELGEDKFSGIGISFGAGMTNVCLSYLSVPVITFSIGKGGDWIDNMSALSQGETASKMMELKEKKLDLSPQAVITDGKEHSTDILLKAIGIHYDALIDYALKSFVKELKSHKDLPNIGEEGIPIVVSGGTSLPKGFIERFRSRLKATDFPIKISEVRHASEPLFSVAKGLLIAAEAAN